MATPPKCKLCGQAHWSTEPHRFAQLTPDPKPSVRKAAPVVTHPPSGDLVEYLAALRAKRAAYMRDYRARLKGK